MPWSFKVEKNNTNEVVVLEELFDFLACLLSSSRISKEVRFLRVSRKLSCLLLVLFSELTLRFHISSYSFWRCLPLIIISSELNDKNKVLFLKQYLHLWIPSGLFSI